MKYTDYVNGNIDIVVDAVWRYNLWMGKGYDNGLTSRSIIMKLDADVSYDNRHEINIFGSNALFQGQEVIARRLLVEPLLWNLTIYKMSDDRHEIALNLDQGPENIASEKF